MRVTVTVNSEQRHADDVWEGESLLYLLRERLGLPGSKNACEQGECGSCTVYLDGLPVCACLVAAGQAEGREVITVEGLATHEAGQDADSERLEPVQEAFVETGAVQCGFCTPGLVVTVHDLLARQANPSDDEIREALAGNLCRCTGYEKILAAVAAGPAPRGLDARYVDGSGCLLTPGLVNTHHHLYQWVTRGLAQDSTLFEWLVALYPVWARIDADAVGAAARAGLGWLALSGCTTSTDHHYVFPRGAGDLLGVDIAAARDVGVRFHPCRGSMDRGRADAGLPPDEVV